MIRTGTLFVLIGVGMSMQAMAADPNRALSQRRQLAACMNRQMAASRTISYNQATTVCKERLKVKAPTLASSVQAEPASGLSR